MTDNTDDSIPSARSIKLTKIITDTADVRDYTIQNIGMDRREVVLESEDIGISMSLCTVDTSRNKIIEMDLTHGNTLSIPQFVERLKTVDEAMREVGMTGFIDHNPLDEVESRLEELEKSVNDQQ